MADKEWQFELASHNQKFSKKQSWERTNFDGFLTLYRKVQKVDRNFVSTRKKGVGAISMSTKSVSMEPIVPWNNPSFK